MSHFGPQTFWFVTFYWTVLRCRSLIVNDECGYNNTALLHRYYNCTSSSRFGTEFIEENLIESRRKTTIVTWLLQCDVVVCRVLCTKVVGV